jgi:hypothetical protein
MTITFQLPSDLEAHLRHDDIDLNAEAREAFLIDLYRRGKLSHHSLSNALGLDRLQTEDALHKHHVTEDLGTLEDYLSDAKTLQQLRDSGR